MRLSVDAIVNKNLTCCIIKIFCKNLALARHTPYLFTHPFLKYTPFLFIRHTLFLFTRYTVYKPYLFTRYTPFVFKFYTLADSVYKVYTLKYAHPTSLLGTHIGVPSLTIPASIATPITMGSRVLKICSVRTRNLQGNIAICLNSSRFFCFNSCQMKNVLPT